MVLQDSRFRGYLFNAKTGQFSKDPLRRWFFYENPILPKQLEIP